MTEQPDPGIVMVRRTAYGRPAEEREERVPVPVFESEVARVAIGTSITRRMTNDFEFMKIEVRVDLPCAPNDRDMRETVAYAQHLIESLIGGTSEPEHHGPIVPAVIPRQPGTPIA